MTAGRDRLEVASELISETNNKQFTEDLASAHALIDIAYTLRDIRTTLWEAYMAEFGNKG